MAQVSQLLYCSCSPYSSQTTNELFSCQRMYSSFQYRCTLYGARNFSMLDMHDDPEDVTFLHLSLGEFAKEQLTKSGENISFFVFFLNWPYILQVVISSKIKTSFFYHSCYFC